MRGTGYRVTDIDAGVDLFFLGVPDGWDDVADEADIALLLDIVAGFFAALQDGQPGPLVVLGAPWEMAWEEGEPPWKAG